MKVHCNEGLATHIGPEPCVCIREDAGEASAGELPDDVGLVGIARIGPSFGFAAQGFDVINASMTGIVW